MPYSGKVGENSGERLSETKGLASCTQVCRQLKFMVMGKEGILSHFREVHCALVSYLHVAPITYRIARTERGPWPRPVSAQP